MLRYVSYLLAVFVVAAHAEPVATYHSITRNGLTLIRTGPAPGGGARQLSVPAVSFAPSNPQSMLGQIASLLPGNGALGEHGALALREVREDAQGTHAVYDQTHRGIPVLGATVGVHGVMKESMVVAGVEWRTFNVASIGLHRRADPDQLFENFFVPGDRLHEHTPPAAIFVVDSSQRLRPAWRSAVEWTTRAAKRRVDDLVLADDDGSMLVFEPLLHFALQRHVTDRSNGNRRDEGQLPLNDAVIDDAYDHLADAYSTAGVLFGLDSFDGQGGAVSIEVNVPYRADNAWYALGSPLKFGVPGQQGNIARDRDVVAHEYAHAILQHQSSSFVLTQRHSSALAESLPDIFAALVSWHLGLPNMWMHGEQFWNGPGDANRYLNDPAANPENPGDGGVDFAADLRACVSELSNGEAPQDDSRQETMDSGDLVLTDCPSHRNSGVSSLAFYLLSEGGFHPRDRSTMSVDGVGPLHAAEIFFGAALQHCDTGYAFEPFMNCECVSEMGATKTCTRADTLQSFGAQTVAVASALFGAQSAELAGTCQTWAAVGVETDATRCAIVPGVPAHVQVASEHCSGFGDVSWDPVAGATHYRVWTYGQHAVLNQGILEGEFTATSAPIVISGPDRDVRVEACNADTCGALSAAAGPIEGNNCGAESGSALEWREVTP